MTRYVSLKKPCFIPPTGIFGPLWSVLYLLMAIAAFAVWTKTGFLKRVSNSKTVKEMT